MRHYFLFTLLKPTFFLCALVLATQTARASLVDVIQQKKWIHGSEDCSENKDPAIDLLKLDEDSFILRQNKCLHYEAPFIYVLFGQSAVFIQDTGATADAGSFPLYKTIRRLADNWQKQNGVEDLRMIVSHSHSHSDHYAADEQFADKENVTLIKPNSDAVRKYFGFDKWPQGMAKVDLGGRVLEVIPLPGHQEDALAVYDPNTGFILSGYSFYPGRLYIQDWQQYSKSMRGMLKFAGQRDVTGFLGTHIEMTAVAGQDYPIGTTYQPDESGLVLHLDNLQELVEQLDAMGNTPARKYLDKTIIYPLDQ